MAGLHPMSVNTAYDELCIVDSGDSTILGIYDPVVLDTTTGMDNIGSRESQKTVQRATAGDGNAIYGVIIEIDQASVESSSMSMSQRHRPASTAMYVTVRRAIPGMRFKIEPSAALSKTDVGSVASLTISDADTTTGLSNAKLDQSTVDNSASSNAQLKIVSILEDDRLDPTKTLGTDILPAVVEINNIEAFHGTVGA